jgi:hypothetical protein
MQELRRAVTGATRLPVVVRCACCRLEVLVLSSLAWRSWPGVRT